jgi:hypothetical protein
MAKRCRNGLKAMPGVDQDPKQTRRAKLSLQGPVILLHHRTRQITKPRQNR